MSVVCVMITGETAFSGQTAVSLSTLVFWKRPRLALKALRPPGCLRPACHMLG